MICDTLQIMLRKNWKRENNFKREPTSKKQNSAVKQNLMEKVMYNLTSKENGTIQPMVPTASVNGTKRNARLQKDFPSTPPGKIRIRGFVLYYILVFYIFLNRTK